jgi:ABC-type phosphate transport system substrate-binding protein
MTESLCFQIAEKWGLVMTTIKRNGLLLRGLTGPSIVFGVLASSIVLEPLKAEEFVSVVGSWSGYSAQSDVAVEFEKATGHRVEVVGQNNRRVFKWLAARRIDVGMWSPLPHMSLKTELEKHFPDNASRPQVFSVGQFAVYIVVNHVNPTQRLTLAQLRGIYSGSIEDWSEVGGGTGRITLIGEPVNAKSREIIHNMVLGAGSRFAGDKVVVPNHQNVINAVAGNRNAIGFLLYKQQPIVGVKLVALAPDQDGPFVPPSSEKIYAQTYPLREHLYLIVRQDANPVAKEYCNFACNQVSATISKKWHMYPEFERQQWLAGERLKQLKEGEGQAIAIAGPANTRKLVEDLSLKYVEAKELVQVSYVNRKSRAEAIDDFQTGDAELLIVEGVAEGSNDQLGEGSESLILGKSALGVIVHPENGLNALLLGELRQIVAGEIKHWPAAKGDGATIRGYGLHGRQAVMQIYRQQLAEQAGGRRSLKLALQADSAKVVMAVARDPAGIGFVDLSHMPPLDGSVVLLGLIRRGEGVSQPQPGQVPDGYPLAMSLTLYVSPAAGAAARDFAGWLAKNPCADVLAQHGLIAPMVTVFEPREHDEPESNVAEKEDRILPDVDSRTEMIVRPPRRRAESKVVASAPGKPEAVDSPSNKPNVSPAKEPSSTTLSTDQIGLIVVVIAGLVLLLIVVSAATKPRRKRVRRR